MANYYYNTEHANFDSPDFDISKYTIDGFTKFREQYYQDIKDKQEHRVITVKLKDLESESSTPRFPEDQFVWNDMDPRFKYFRRHIPMLDLRNTLNVRVTAFNNLQDIRGELKTKEARHFRDIIDKELREYCPSSKMDPDFWPVPGQIFFAHVQPKMDPISLKKVKEHLEVKLSGKREYEVGWLAEDSDDSDDEKKPNDPIWMRAEFLEHDAAENLTSIYLIDTGEYRTLALPKEKMRRAVFRYISWPALGIGIIVTLEKPVQYSEPLSEKWSKLILMGMKLLLEICALCNGRYLTRLISPTEEELEYLYTFKRLHGDTKDKANGRVSDPAIPWKYGIHLGFQAAQAVRPQKTPYERMEKWLGSDDEGQEDDVDKQ